jgi:two-component system cell cycle sensor histidine kinase/response regulator CckA
LLDRLAAPLDAVLRVLVEGSAVGIAVIDPGGRLVRVNGALRRMVDRECNLSPGCPAEAMFSEQHRQEVWQELAPALAGGRAPCTFITVLRGKGGVTEQTVEVSAVALQEADGSISGVVLQFSDISAQRHLEAQLVHSQKLQAVGQLAGGIAHDFNNLLTAVLGAADDALGRGQPEPDTVEDLQQIRAAAERGAALVRQLLAFGRQQTLKPCVVSINIAMQGLSGLLRRLLGSTIRLELDLEQPGRTVRVDPTQLDQVLINLAVNARDAMPDGGQLTLRTGHIILYRALVRGEETIQPGSYVMVEVQDSGVGIAAEVLPRIFDPFFTTRREGGGSGLGLSTVHGIVRQSDGFLAVDSIVGTGTRIRIYLPWHEEEIAVEPVAEPVSPVVVSTSPGATGRTVLLVDDEAGVRRLAMRALTNRGWTVLAAGSGEAALDLLTDPAVLASLCLIISDVVMPGMGGPALVRAVRELRPGLPAILASGYAQEAVRGDLVAEAIGFLPKPYTLKAMVAAVEARANQGALDTPGGFTRASSPSRG